MIMTTSTLAIDPTKPTTFSGAFKHLSPPTAVDHCLFCHLLHPRVKNIVLVRGYFIDIYTLKQDGSGETYLNWVTTTCVYEEVVDIAAVKFFGDTLDSLLISFREAKLAVMGFDASQYDLRTLSLHNYEFENLKSGRIQFSRLPLLRVDPLQRCAVMLVFDRHLAVLPFRRSETFVAGDKYISKPLDCPKSSSWDRRTTAPLLATFTTCLSSSTGEKINNVLDMQFMHGYYEPTLLVLYESIGTWAGRVSARRDTCSIVALSFNLQKRTNPVIWFQESLPFDCKQICAVPQPIGGILVVATNSILYMKQTLPSCGLPLNCYAQVTTNFPMRQDVPSCGPLTLDGSQITCITDSQFLIAARTGKLYLLSLWVERATQTVSSLLLHEVGQTTIPSCLGVLGDGYLFVGSRRCDSVLMQFSVSTICVNTTGEIVEHPPEETDTPMLVDSGKVNSTVKHDGTEDSARKVVTGSSGTNGTTTDTADTHSVDAIDIELYGESILNPPSKYREIDSYTFEVIDRLKNFGPMSTLTAGEVPCLAPGNTDPSDETLTAAQADMQHVELIACIPRPGGSESDNPSDLRKGGILLMHTSVRSRGLTAFELPEYVCLWSLYGPPVVASTHAPDKTACSPVENETSNEMTDIKPEMPEETEEAQVPTPSDDNIEEQSFEEPLAKKARTESEDPEQMTASPKETPMESNTSEELADKSLKATPISPPGGQTHSYLLLTREDSTMILEVSHEIVELETSGFNTTEMTVTVVNLGEVYMSEKKFQLPTPTPTTSLQHAKPDAPQVGTDYPYILQVSPTSLRLLDGPKLIEYIQVTREWRIHLASSADPYVLVCTEDDELFLIRLLPPSLDDSSNTTSRYPHKKASFLDLKAARDMLNPDKDDVPCSVPFATTSHLEFYRPKVEQVSAPLSFCLYHDRSGSLAHWLWKERRVPVTTDAPENSTSPVTDDSHLKDIFFPTADAAAFSHMNDVDLPSISTVDEEDLMLYGELMDRCKQEGSVTVPPSVSFKPTHTDTLRDIEHSMLEEPRPDRSTYFAFILFTNGVLEIYSLPDFTLLYQVHQFSDLPALLVDQRGVTPDPKAMALQGDPSANEETVPAPVLEISVLPIGRKLDRPILFARTTQEVAFFEALCPSSADAHPFTAAGQSLRWRRLSIPCPLIAPRKVRSDPKIADVQSALHNRTTMLRPFNDIEGHRGLFVCGATPMWIFGTDTGQLRVFTHSIDGIMGSFAPLNTTICPSGFVYFTYSNEMRLATLPPGYSYRENLGIRWVPLDITPYFVQYHIDSKTYAVVGTRPELCCSVYHLNAEGNKEEEQLLRPPTCVLPTLDRYSLQLYAPSIYSVTDAPWKPIPNTLIEFDEWEVVTTMITAQLASEQTFHGTKDYLAIGTNLSYGEEIPIRGRILILDVIDVVPEPGQPLTRHKLKTIHDGEQKGPVTALTSCQGNLISAIGQKVYIWSLKNADLNGIAFIDSELYIHNLLCVKNLVLAADVIKSIQVLRFQPDSRVLSLVSRDSIAREVYTCNFFVDGRRLGFLVTDEHGNVVIYSYDPLDPISRNGRRLVRRADMRLPTLATCSLRVANRLRHALLSVKPSSAHHASSAPAIDAPDASTVAETKPGAVSVSGSNIDPERTKQSVYMGTQSGAILILGPIRDKMYSRLRITEKNLIHHLGPTCGMLPKLCWSYRPTFPELANPCGQIADADLLWRFLVLPHSQRLEIAKKSGQSLEGIMDDIADLNSTTLHF